jgi:hypothetical protein
MLMAGQDPVVRPPASQDPKYDLDDEHPMDEDECLDFVQEPLPSPTPTGVLGPTEQLL